LTTWSSLAPDRTFAPRRTVGARCLALRFAAGDV